MQIKFLGGASHVGSLGMLLRDSGQVLFDYGFLPGDPPSFPMKAPPVDAVFLSHCHIDHSGMTPWLAHRYDCPIYATHPTIDVSELLLNDSVKIAKLEGYPQPYNLADVARTMRNFKPVDFGETVEEGGLEVNVFSAGHVPGAAMYDINGRETTLFTGDLHTLSTNLVYGANPVKCDNLIIESTYAGRNHPPRHKVEYEFVRKIKRVLERGGRVIVPAFAVGRTQEVLMVLAGQRFDVALDGMGESVNRIYLRWPDYLRSAKKLRDAARRVDAVKGRKRRQAVKAEVVVCTSGMLDGGPVINYLNVLKDDPRNAILLTGYQVEGTNGRMLVERGMVELQGVDVEVKAEVESFDFSAHAGHDELVSFIDRCDPKRVVLMHGDNRKVLARALEGREVLLPMEGEWVGL